jgi:ATP-dependent Zn protease
MFDTEIRGQMAMLMGGRAAEELTCGQVRAKSYENLTMIGFCVHNMLFVEAGIASGLSGRF